MTSQNKLQVYFNRESLESLLASDHRDFLIDIYVGADGTVSDAEGKAYKMNVAENTLFPICPYPCKPPRPKAIEGCGDFKDRLEA